MRLKQFIFALVAMLSLTFSVSAQTTVSTAADLKDALSSTGAVVTLGDDITMTEVISIPQGISVTLDLNGKKITGNHSGYVFDITGSLTVNDSQGTGTVTGKSRVFTVKSKGSLTLNGGKFSKTSDQVIYTSGKLVVNGGVVETAPNATLNVNTAAITGAGGTVVLKGGTVTSIAAQFCDLKISGAGATVTDGLNIFKGAKGAEITAGTIKGDVTIADEAKSKVTISGGSFEDTEAIKDCMEDGSALLQKPDGSYEIVAGLLKIDDTYYPTLDAAFKAAEDGATIELINQEGAVIAMNGSLYGKNVTITGTANVDWSKGWLFVGRGGEGNATLTFDNANLTSASNNASYGIHVSGREKGTADKYDGTVVIKNSTIVLDFLINKGAMTLDNSTLTVKNGFDLNGRPASETENGEDANATLALTNNSKLVVNNHNGMGIGREGKGELTVDASSTFEHTQDFIVRANGTMDVKGTLVSNGKKLTNNGEVKFTATKLTAATIEGTGTTRFYNDVNFYGANSITTTGINGTPFHLVINEGANLFITRFVLGYDRNITVNGTIADASAFNPAGQTPSLKFNSTSGVSVGGTGTGNLTVKNAYIELGSSSWKSAQGTYDWDFVNSYVSATSFTNATGADAATWDVTFDKSVLAAKNYIKNGKNVTYNFTNNSRGTTGSLRIDGVLNIDATSSVVTTSQQNNVVGVADEHGGINGTVNVAGNLTIGSNAKTQLEVLGGTVNVVNGATLALGNNTMTLDAASALQSAGNISGAITAANGANVAITGGTYTQDVSNWCADGFMTQQNADGSFGIAKAAAKVGDKKYASLDEAVQAAKVGDKIALLDNADLAFAHNPQFNNVYASEIDLNGKTMTIKKGDVRFDNVTIKNGNIIVQPGTYNGTAIFLMYSKNLTFDGVKVTATGVAAAAYLIGLEGTSNLNLLNGSEIVINNESLVNIGSIIADNGNGNTVTIKDSKIDIKNSNARLYLGGTNGNITVENSDIDLNGVKEGFYLRAGQTLAITGTSTVDITLNTNEGRYGINLTDLTATYTKAETATVNATLKEVTPAAVIGSKKFASLQAAINAVKDGETITLTDNVTGDVTLTEKVGLHYTIDGAGKTMNGKITITPLSDENDNRRITIKGINFVNTADAAVDFISCAVTNHYPRLTVEGCTFTGNGKNTDVALRLKTAYGAVIKDCTGTGLHSFLQNTAGKSLTIEGVTVTESKGAFALGTVQGVTIKGSTIDVATYGIRMDANTYNNNAVIEGNNVTAFIPVVVRNVNTQSNVTFTGENTFTADNTDGKWMVIGTTEYEENGKLPAEVATGNVVVALNGTNLSYEGVHGAGLAGKGTAEAPYLINNIAELEIFRNSVNAGSTKYSMPGLCVALNADIDMTGVNWVGIGTATADHGFMGNFDGKNFKIKNLTIDNPALDSDGYAYAGLFGVTEGTDKDNQNTIKNLTIENVTINTTGDIVSAAIAYPYYTIVENVKVCGNIAITGGNYTAGVLAYTRRCVNASNLSIVGNDGSYVKGNQTVGGVISDIQMNGGLTAVYSNFSAEGITVTGEKSVGGIAGIIATQTLNGATVKNVTLSSTDEFAGVVAGRLGGTSTISNVVSENVTGATAVIGATFDGAKAVEARIGDTYYSTFAAAYTAAKAGETVSMLVDLNMSEILVLDKAITLDGNGKKLTSTAGRAINVDCEGNVGIKNLTINASGERAINVIQKPATVTIENVTATAANYTVNLASSAGAAKVAISNSNLTGLNVVNVASAGANVTIEGGTITCNDQNANENYAALALNKDAVGAKIAATGVTFDIKGESKKASNGAVDGEITIDGKTDEVVVNVAYISYGNNYYSFTSIEAAIEAAKAGETIGLIRDVKASDIITINKAITLDGNGKTLTSTAGRAINVSGADGATIKNLTIDAKGERAINVIQNATNVTIDGVTATAKNYTVNVAASAPNAVVAINNSTLNGLCTVNVSAAGANVTVDNSTVNCNDNNTTAGESYAALSLNKEAVGGSIVATESTINVTDGSDSMKGRNGAENGTVTINGSTDDVAVMVAKIEYPNSDAYHAFATLEEAIEFAKAGNVVTLIRDITTSAQININKNVAIDGCDKKLTVNAARGFQITGGTVAISNLTIDMPNAAEGNRGINLYNGDTNAALDVTLNNVTINGGKAYAVNIGGGKDNKLTINGSTLTGYAAINVHTSSVNHTIVVDGSTLNGKNHNNNYSFGTVVVDGTNAHSLTITNTTITTENLEGVTSKYEKVVVGANCTLNWDGGEAAVRSILADSKGGKLYYTDLQTAINDAAEVSGTVQILGNITATKSIAIPAAKKVTINLNGKTITGTDNETKSYGLININPGAELTINDATTGNGAIKLTATNNREWNAYSSVISNQRGKLTVNGGTIEHLGGTDMAYAIDILTNTGAQNAEAVINGGTIKSTYRAIRQFLNSSKAKSILTVNGGTIEGGNKSIWMQDANASANPGALTVAADAKLTGDVYLTVTAGSTAWPVEVAIAAAALQGESKVLDNGNVPAGYDLANVDGIYGVYSGAAKIGTTYYETIEAAIKAAKAGETVNILAGTYKVPSMKAGITVEGAVNADGTPAVLLEGTLSNTLENLTLKNLHIKGGNAQRWAYAKGDLVFENVIFEATSVYAIHFDGIAAGTNLTYKNCTIIGWAAMGGTPESCVFDGCTIKGNGSYGVIRTYFDAEIKDCTFDVSNVNTNDAYQDGIHAVDGAEVVVDGCTNVNGTMKDLVNISGTSEVTVDGIVYKNVAKVADKNYITIEDAFAAWADGTTLTLLTDVALNTKTLATQNDGYATIVNVAGKAVTLDLNGKKITVNAAAADLASAKGGMLLGVFSADLNGHLTLTDNTDAKNGAVTLNVNDAKVYGMFVSESGQSDKSNSGKITVNGGNYTTVGKVANAMFFTDANEVITVNGGNFHCDQVSNTANYPWMFNTLGNNELHVTVNGGTFNIDINHQHRPFEVKVPETLAVKANDNGTWTVVPAEAYITEMLGATVNEAGEWGHKVGYATIAEAIAAVNELGNKVSIAKDLELTETVVVPADKTMVLDLNGKTVTMNDASGAAAALLKNNGNLTITDGTEAKAGKLSFKTTTPSAANAYASNTISNYGTLTIEGGNVENLSVGGGACYALDNYAGSTATINGGKLTAEKTAVRIFNWTDGEAAKATINMNGGEIYSKNGYGINVNSGNKPFVALNIAGGTITSNYADYKLAVYVVNKGNAENLTINVTGGTFNGIFALNGVTAKTMKQDAVAVSGGTFEGVTCYDDPAYGFVSGGTFKSAVDAKAVATGYICKDNGDGTFGVIVDPKHGKVAQIIRNDYYAENQYFATINEAVQAAVTGETVTLIADVETSAAKLATVGKENYAVLVAVKEKDITLDLNGKSVTVTPTADELANAENKMLMSVFGMDTNGKLKLTGNGSVKVNANGANVYSLIAAYGEGSAVEIENGNYEADTVMSSGSLIYSHEMITVNGGNYKLGNLATGANGSPWIFNTVGQNYTDVKVVGGTFPTDINHQFWANEVLVPEAYALKDNGDGTWTVVDAVAYTNEKATSRNASWRHVGYASLEDAIAATGKYNCENNTVTMIKDITLEPITIANGVEVALDLNGKTISGTDNGTASYGLITNKGDLTINGTGAITLTATQNRGWNAYSSVISNQPGGKLTVNGGTIQHLGGTAMAWGIDNLTNGKGTYAETEINGGVVKSKYIAIRQFLNGVEADNILTVNGGTLEGETASLYFQDPSKNANTGTLNVLDGTLAGDVYLDVTEGSTEWPVEVYIAKDALDEYVIHTENIPAEAAALVEYDTFWQVEQKNLAELTIEDACEEYINKIEKNVGVLTYERYFDDTEWQTIVLPFDVPVANLTEQFEVAYIYNAEYKGKQANIDYVVIDENSAIETLRANYPYMIRAKEAGWNNIVVEKAKLMPTEVEILDCSSVFEKFSFIGSYATVDTETLDATKGYFNLISGAWSQLGTVNPFRFYMQIEKRDGSAFEYPGTEAKAIRMRQVNANGEATGIDSVGAVTEQNSGLIFDLHGRRVVEPKKGGLYIVNGKKVVF